jgi:hypothetical protein
MFRVLMNKAHSDRIHELCSQIAVEQDHKKFLALVEELNSILSSQGQSFDKNIPEGSEKS